MIKKIIKNFLLKIYRAQIRMAQQEDYESYRRKYTIDRFFRFNGRDIQLYGDGEIILGQNSYVGALSTLQAERGSRITIGKHCRISHNVRIYTMSNYPDQDFTAAKVSKISGDVTIGDGVWIGVNVFIGPGISIGNNAIVGANSVVSTSIPDGAIYGGIPAKLIRMKKFL
jgi:maltose O-acetyltransferase